MYKDADNKNRKLLRENKKDLKYLTQIVNDNFEDIKSYWYADPTTVEGKKLINSIRNKIAKKYDLNIMEI